MVMSRSQMRQQVTKGPQNVSLQRLEKRKERWYYNERWYY